MSLNIVLPATADQEVLTSWLGALTLNLCVYDNNQTPVKASVAGDFNQAVDGITAIKWTLTGGSWSISNDGTKGIATNGPLTWTFSNPVSTMYGVFATDLGPLDLEFAALFDGGPLAALAGQVLTVSVEIDCD